MDDLLALIIGETGSCFGLEGPARLATLSNAVLKAFGLCVSLSNELALLALVTVLVRGSFLEEDGAVGGYANDCEG